ncbi:MAG TPA: isoprenylcysteine carboxylmethyltransferase family protein [Candidatus Angelobacter sp.]|nr:isoprenylcysteine carboxylmethyltransferase family protein [Candidatus Angelobacter sp.]
MQRKRIIVLVSSAAVGAVIGALAPSLRGRQPRLSLFALDQPLLEHKGLLVAAVAGWVLFSLYWEVAAHGAAEAKSSESRLSRSFHVILTNLALLMAIAPIRVLGRFLPVSVWIMALGLGVEYAGLSLAIWARRHLGRNWSGEISIKVDHELVRSGPYRKLRHPIYTALLTMYLGVTLVTGEGLALGGLLLAAFAYWRKIRLEEANLNAAFGSSYQAYRRESWALVPGIF